MTKSFHLKINTNPVLVFETFKRLSISGFGLYINSLPNASIFIGVKLWIRAIPLESGKYYFTQWHFFI